jgi:uncharacterized protein (TIGR03067 family)
MNYLPATLLALVVAAPALKETDRPLLGQWVCTARTYNGQVGDPDPCVWEFAAGGKLLRRLKDDEPAEWRYIADPAKTPASINLSSGEEDVQAIYRVVGETLTVCYSHTAAERPTVFDSPKGAHLVLLTFKRPAAAKR